MRINISGKNMDTGTSLKEHIQEHLPPSVQKYFENAINANVVFSKQGNFITCHIDISEGVKNGIEVSASAETDDVYTAFNEASTKAVKQLRRHHRKMKSRSDKVSLAKLNLAASA